MNNFTVLQLLKSVRHIDQLKNGTWNWISVCTIYRPCDRSYGKSYETNLHCILCFIEMLGLFSIHHFPNSNSKYNKKHKNRRLSFEKRFFEKTWKFPNNKNFVIKCSFGFWMKLYAISWRKYWWISHQ